MKRTKFNQFWINFLVFGSIYGLMTLLIEYKDPEPIIWGQKLIETGVAALVYALAMVFLPDFFNRRKEKAENRKQAR